MGQSEIPTFTNIVKQNYKDKVVGHTSKTRISAVPIPKGEELEAYNFHGQVDNDKDKAVLGDDKSDSEDMD